MRIATRILLVCLLAGGSLSAAVDSTIRSKSAPAPTLPPPAFAVVELFTSEGCSSCPPADKLLSELAAQAERDGKPVFALSFHVDYWNQLGWADPFSRSEFTDRQQRYARDMGGRVYTPQMIVNGSDEFVGSQAGAARKSIAAALERSASVAIGLGVSEGPAAALRVRFQVTGQEKGDLLNLALVEKGLVVPVKRGENGGRTLKHENVVREFRTVRLDARGAGEIAINLKDGVRRENAFLVAYAQKPESLRILGAARFRLP